MKTTLKKIVWTWALCLMAAFALGAKAQAATPTIYKFEPSYNSSAETYKGMDVTGDKVNDTVKVKYKEVSTGYMVCRIYVNGKQVFKQKRGWEPTWTIQLIRLQNGKVLFDINSTIGSDDACIHCLYVYKNGKLQKMYDFQKHYAKYASYYSVDITGVTGNKMKATTYAMFYLTGSISYDMNFVYKGGKVKLGSNKYKIQYGYTKNNWTVGRTMKVYKKPGSKKQVFTLRDGDKVKINKVVYKKNKPYIQVQRTKGKVKIGYIPGVKKHTYPYYFDEAMFAG